MDAFVDPRTSPVPDVEQPSSRTTREPKELEELHHLCREGRLYDVERWIQAGRPLQLAERTALRRRRSSSALEIALEAGNHALVLLLLCNGYDPNQERQPALDLVLRARRFDLLDLLLEWGADPDPYNPNRKVRLHIDHEVPVSQGGTDVKNNLRAVCSACNQTRSNIQAPMESSLNLLARIRRAPRTVRKEVYTALKKSFGD